MSEMTLANLLSAPARQPTLSGEIVYLTGETLFFSEDRAISFQMSEGVSNGQLLGGAFSASCSLTLHNADGYFTDARSLSGAQIRVNLCLGDFVFPLCVFFVSKAASQEGDLRLILTGHDALGVAFESAFSDEFVYPLTLGELASQLASLSGFALAADFPNADVVISSRPDWGNISIRQALAYTAGAAGCFAAVNRMGRLEFRSLCPGKAPYSISPDVTLSREYGEKVFGPLTALSIACKGAPRGTEPLLFQLDGTAPSNQNCLYLSNHPLFPYQGEHTEILAQGLLSALEGLSYTQAKIQWRGDPGLLLGDPVAISDTQGNITHTIITRQSLSFSRGFSMQSDCTVQENIQSAGRIFTSAGALNAAMLSGFINGAIIQDGSIAARSLIAGCITALQLAANAITTEKIAADAVTADKIAGDAITAHHLSANAIQAHHLSTDALSAVDAHIQSADIDWAEIDALNAAVSQMTQAAIGTADVDFARIKDLAAGTAIITKGSAGELYIAKLAVTEANLLSLSVGELLVKGADGGFYALTVDENGDVITARKQIGNEDILHQGIHGGEKIMEGTITAATLNVQDIFGESAIIQSLIAAKLDVDSLFSREATLQKINALDITGNESIRLYVKQQEELSVYLRVTENGLEIGKVEDSAKFRADNRTLEVTNIKTERLGIAQRMSQGEEWAWVAAASGLGLKYVG